MAKNKIIIKIILAILGIFLFFALISFLSIKYFLDPQVKSNGNNNVQAQRKVEVIVPNTKGIPILMYHFFYDSAKGETPADANFTDINNFREQIKYLKDNDYYFPTWIELNDYLDGNLVLPEKSIIITDDDGSESFFRLAYPVLKEYKVRATSFIITSWTPNPDSLNVDRNLIKFESHSDNMHQGGCSGGHGSLFLCIDHEAGKKDLMKSKQVTGASEVFCYPFGDYNDAAKQLLKETGYIMAVTTEWGNATIGMDKLTLPRIRMQGTYTLDNFIGAIR